jgi:tetratricopeptide (TPR) repeat protein
MSAAEGRRPSIVTYVSVLLRVTYTTLAYWVVGLMPEENHCRKALAWMRIDAHRFAAWHWRKYLKYSEDSRARASLAWCYANLGMLEPAVEHYRLAYARNKDPEIALYLAQVELDFGNVDGARALMEDIASRRHRLSDELLPTLADLETRLSASVRKYETTV